MVHFFMNSKGGVGKSLSSCLVAQYVKAAEVGIICFDADAMSASGFWAARSLSSGWHRATGECRRWSRIRRAVGGKPEIALGKRIMKVALPRIQSQLRKGGCDNDYNEPHRENGEPAPSAWATNNAQQSMDCTQCAPLGSRRIAGHEITAAAMKTRSLGE
jgi:hypothetical protein